jgi:UDP-glucose 4-epimerase
MTAQTFSGKRVLITGANGFIGSRLATRLARDGAMVHAVVSPESAGRNLMAAQGAGTTRSASAGAVTLERVDLRDEQALASLVKRIGPRVVYHLASYGNHPGHYDAADALCRIAATNLMGMANLLAACRDLDLECLINTGSAFAEYGAGVEPMRETQRLAPSTYYGASKAGATLLAGAFAAATGRRVITLRPLYVYGPGDWPGRFVPRVVAACLRGVTLPLTSRRERKNFVFVDDVVEAYLAAGLTPQADATIVNVGAREEATLGDVIAIVERRLGREVRVTEGAYDRLQWPGDCWAADISLAESVLGWTPVTSLEEGIRRTVDAIVAGEPIAAGGAGEDHAARGERAQSVEHGPRVDSDVVPPR